MLRWLISKLITNLLTISIKVCIRLDIFNIKKMSQKSKTTCRRGEHFRHLARVIHTNSCSDSTILLVSQSVWSIDCFIPDPLCGNCSVKFNHHNTRHTSRMQPITVCNAFHAFQQIIFATNYPALEWTLLIDLFRALHVLL